jgi:transketolase
MLKSKAKEIRKHIIKMLMEAGSGHPGGSLSAVELVTTLYFYKMRHDPHNPYWEDRDRFILSKGHAAPLLYAVLAEAGYFPKDELKTLRKINSRLQGHPDRLKLPGVEMTTGSLGIGLSVAVGIALAGKLNKRNYNVYVLLGDGEVQEGQIWEAAMSAAHYRLGNLTAILDRNGLQLNGPTEKIMSIEPLAAKWKAFNWRLIEIDGYDFEQIIFALNEAEKTANKPTMILAHTTKGKGVSFMEWSSRHHGYATDKETLQKLLEQM